PRRARPRGAVPRARPAVGLVAARGTCPVLPGPADPRTRHRRPARPGDRPLSCGVLTPLIPSPFGRGETHARLSCPLSRRERGEDYRLDFDAVSAGQYLDPLLAPQR